MQTDNLFAMKDITQETPLATLQAYLKGLEAEKDDKKKVARLYEQLKTHKSKTGIPFALNIGKGILQYGWPTITFVVLLCIFPMPMLAQLALGALATIMQILTLIAFGYAIYCMILAINLTKIEKWIKEYEAKG